MTSLPRKISRYLLRLGLPALLGLAMLATAPATYAVPKGQTIYVDPAEGSDANTGELTQPYRTLFKALEQAHAGDIIRLAAGVYSQATNGEQFGSNTAPIPGVNAVTIVGAIENGVPASTLQGTGSEVGLRLQGGSTAQNLNLNGFDMAILAVAGKNSLSNLSMAQNAVGVWVGNASQTTLKGSTIALSVAGTGVIVAGQGQLTMDGGKISGGGVNCTTDATGMFFQDSALVTIKNGATLENIAGNALYTQSTLNVTLDGATISRSLPNDCTPKPSVRAVGPAVLTINSSLIRSIHGTNAGGIETQQSVQLTLNNSNVSRHTGTAIRMFGGGKLTVNGGGFTSNQIGIDASSAPQASITITGATVQYSSQVGIIAPALKLRGSTVNNNGVGIKVTSASADLGILADPGNNTIKDSTTTGVTFAGGVGSGNVSAVGNTWNPNTQDTDASGHYTVHMKVIGIGAFAHGKNFDLPNGSFSIEV